MSSRSNNKEVKAMLYIMKAYHIYEDHSVVRLQHVIDDNKGYNSSLVFAVRESGNKDVPVVISSSGPTTKGIYNSKKYTIDTGSGYRNKGYEIEVIGFANLDPEGNVIQVDGVTPGIIHKKDDGTYEIINNKVNAFVFK